MLKNLLRIPDTFEPDDRRRRQVLNVLLIICASINLMIMLLVLINSLLEISDPNDKNLPTLLILSLIFYGILLWINRSPRIPAWLTGIIFIAFTIVLCLQTDSPAELYNGRSTIILTIPILLGTLIFPTGYQFFIALIISLIMQFFTPPDVRYPGNSVNYFSVVMILLVTLLSWFSQRISQRAIRDAHEQAKNASRHAANLEAIVNSITDGVLVRDVNGHFISANPALLRMIPKEQLLELIAKPFDNKIRLNRKMFFVSIAPVPEVGTVAIFRDETRRHEADQAKNALLATVSHELRTPLTAMMNYLEMIQVFIRMGKVNTSEFEGYLERAIGSAHRLRELINNILDQAQIQAGVLEIKHQLFNLPALLEKNRQLLDTLLKQKNLSYSLQIAPNVPAEINGDPDRLHQVLINLVGNAIKFTKQGGVQVKIFLLGANQLAIEVVDSGPGIPEQQIPDIFEAFRRGSDYAQREQQGAGLGLSITQEIIHRMGGNISVASTLGSGSTFTVSIPLQTG